MRSRRFTARESRELSRETLVSPLPELGLVASGGPRDPEPELVARDGRVVRMDGRDAADFDVIDRFVVAHGLDLEVAPEAMALDDVELARRLVDVGVPRGELVRLSRGLTPAKLARVIGLLDPVELMLALNHEQHTSLVLVTHDRSLARRLDRVMELHEGKLRQLSHDEV